MTLSAIIAALAALIFTPTGSATLHEAPLKVEPGNYQTIPDPLPYDAPVVLSEQSWGAL